MATLLGEPFRLRLPEIAGLTDRQLYDLYCHARDDEGKVDTQSGQFGGDEMTFDEATAAMRQMASSMGISPEKIRELEERARAKRGG